MPGNSKQSRGKKTALLVSVAVVVTVCSAVWAFRHDLQAHYEFWRTFERLGMNAHGYPEYRHRNTEIIFVRLPGGTFTRGSPETEVGRDDKEGPVHEVELSAFLVSKYEVTLTQWRKVMGHVASDDSSNGSLPVSWASWDDCREFCTKTGLSLPTEAQWEYACRAGTPGPVAGTGNLDEMAWYRANSNDRIQPVGGKAPNDFGLHDMHGNVWEWCKDVYDSDFYSKRESRQPDPVSLSGRPNGRVLRGGDYDERPVRCRSAFRFWSSRRYGRGDAGFRPTAPAN